jgi:1,2-dihydroxy-3-keto-5-methylthiopentene dioxygenase
MSHLKVYEDRVPDKLVLHTTDDSVIAQELGKIGVFFKRWESPVAVDEDDADTDWLLDVHRPYLDRLMGAPRVGSADIVRLRPGAENYPALREQFRAEHTHTEDEVRFFIHGDGTFFMHVDSRVYEAFCTAGDLISVPAELRHWFDAGREPNFTALRLFTDPSGWHARYTSDTISQRFAIA